MSDANLATLLVLISAFMHASWNAVVKSSSDRLSSMAMVDGVAFVVALLAVPFVALPAWPVWGLILLSVGVNLFYRYFLIRAYHFGDFGQVYPLVRGLPPLLVVAFAAVWLGESLSASGMLGVVILSLGILSLLNLKGEWRAPRNALAAGVCVALYTVIDAQGVRSSQGVLSYLVYFTLVLSLPIPFFAARRRRGALVRHLQEHWRMSVFGGLTYCAAYALVLWAMTLDNVAKIAALRESSVIIGAVIATLLFKEPFGRRRLIAAVTVAVGIVLIKCST
ncbi:EamA family transporter [Pseudomonas vancouverensis]|uniref:EamA family transporter n=1 Tax=Pseudomonas vancouverensis TaxID=95300 RepID=A0A1H2NAX9_PSEVA|nr:EamA family transporter [Pseudomonas vancouverensis]KAB0494109.1 EamA family transporter [Pseudomonas vancouverensis]TDB61546.1 EamA family transporter [Pseudomonas vancouverensis]SDV02532.1 EamA-like transporter family protein [Pseudomonas vancouverensis]